jgi:hypothetical protein
VIEVVVGVSAAGVVANPFAVVVYVRSFGMSGRVGIMMFLRTGSCMRLTTGLGGTMLGNSMFTRFAAVFFTLAFTMLCPNRNGNNQQYHKNSTEPFHASLLKASHGNAPQAF